MSAIVPNFLWLVLRQNFVKLHWNWPFMSFRNPSIALSITSFERNVKYIHNPPNRGQTGHKRSLVKMKLFIQSLIKPKSTVNFTLNLNSESKLVLFLRIVVKYFLELVQQSRQFISCCLEAILFSYFFYIERWSSPGWWMKDKGEKLQNNLEFRFDF